MAESRILKEIEDIYRDPPDFITAGPIDDNNIYHWEATIYGPDDSDYKNGVFLLDIIIPKEYPFKPPKCKFKTKIFHPNISDTTGYICVNILEEEKWNPTLTISNVLMSILVLLYDPYPKSPMNGKAAELYIKKREEYKRIAQQWINDYSGQETFK